MMFVLIHVSCLGLVSHFYCLKEQRRPAWAKTSKGIWWLVLWIFACWNYLRNAYEGWYDYDSTSFLIDFFKACACSRIFFLVQTCFYQHLHAITCCLELFDTCLHFDDVIWSTTCVLMFFQAYYSRIFVVLLSNVLLNNWFSSAYTTEPLSLCYGCKKIFDRYNTQPIKYLLWL